MSREGFRVKRYHEHLLITGELLSNKEMKSVVKLGRLLHKTAHVLNNIHNRSLQYLKVNTQQTVILSFIAQNEKDGVNSRDIEGLLSITNPSVSSIISSMEKKDLIFKRKDPKDKRNQLLYLTKPGYELAKESSKVMIENNQKTFGVLNEEEQNQLNTLLTKLFERSEDLK